MPKRALDAHRGLPINFMAQMFDNLMPDIEAFWDGEDHNPHVFMA